jgi:glycopeptide antibiotics resistance protein
VHGRRREARIGLAVWVLLVAVLTLAPNPGRGQRLNLTPGFTSAYGHREVAVGFALNVVLFLPFGLLAADASVGLRRWWQVLAVAALLSIGIETAQWFAHIGRAADINDVIANAAGGLIGYVLRAAQQPRR